MTKVSIITPSYNRAWILQNCLDSVQGQTYNNIEHIVVDACSNDGTLAILKANESSHGLRWISESDKGMYDAINKGVQLAGGDIVAYLNTDDFYFPYTIELVVEFLNQHPDIELVYGDWVTFYSETSFLEVMPYPLFDSYDMAYFACLPQTAVFMRKSAFDKVGFFDISYKLMADNEFFSRAAVSGLKLAKISEILAGQTVHQGNLLAGNANAVVRANAEASRYRAARQAELSKQPEGLHWLKRLRVKIRSSLYSVTWRVFLVNFMMRAKVGQRGQWDRFLTKHPVQKVSLLKLIRYLINRKRNPKSLYWILPNFKP